MYDLTASKVTFFFSRKSTFLIEKIQCICFLSNSKHAIIYTNNEKLIKIIVLYAEIHPSALLNSRRKRSLTLNE